MIGKLVGARVALAPMTEEHADLMAGWLNDLEVAIALGDDAYRSITPARMREQIAKSEHDFVILARGDDGAKPIGHCLLFKVNHIDRSAEVGIYVGDKDCWNLGLGGEALQLLLEYAFGLLNLSSVMLSVFAFNTRAISCYRRIGFKEIGRQRRARLIAGKYHDVILMDMLAEEFNGHLVEDVVDSISRGRQTDMA